MSKRTLKEQIEKRRFEEAMSINDALDALRTGDYSSLDQRGIKYLTKDIILTTETSPTDMYISKRLEIISAECVYGMNIFRGSFVVTKDFLGGRSAESQKVLRDARKTCLLELMREALIVGADAVIAVDLDYSEISNGGKPMLLLVATGTAVKTKQDLIE